MIKTHSKPGVGLEAINATWASERGASRKPKSLVERLGCWVILPVMFDPMMFGPSRASMSEIEQGSVYHNSIPFNIPSLSWDGLAIKRSFTASLEEPAKRKPKTKQAPGDSLLCYCVHGIPMLPHLSLHQVPVRNLMIRLAT